jgi:hypothetical protein
MFHHQNSGQNHNINMANVPKFTYLGKTVTNQNLIHEENKRRLNSGKACYLSVQNISSSCLLSKNIKMIKSRMNELGM